ncbi:hypothetical protein CONCODRAFT_20426 [Conidiobolus coronatus NRRL 28638]|uniref:F-box domain-containing protein n=1 Tax=Conidiobolus coronatus (strain ATCC 28846 / CBS 209.66 / NRRL 28638) TaxID=796925 RepID=A0A137NTK8_CONC2|nr:hypothetical protein CONCODRAFT_20426 [Conidiobolus coronatus NRRL 28638]|eukprot:KXN66090.1 hypothetical protein CONCODRAFT_20426 [Conidiobolus coronatus NRRL 28638]
MNQSVLKDKLNSKAWVYLPDVDTLSQYFNQSDLIEISKVCKNYRAQLKSQVRKKLLISYSIIKLLNIRPLSGSHGYEDVINCLRLDFSGDYHLVKQVIIDIGISKKFACDFFNLFSKLSNIQILICKRYDLKSYIETLNSSANLQHITLSSEYKNFDSMLNNIVKGHRLIS